MNDELLPQDIETEERIISTCLIDTDDCKQFLILLEPEHFYKTEHKQIFKAMCEMQAEGKTIALDSVYKFISENGDRKAGAVKLSKFADIPICTGDLKFYTEKIIELAKKRDLIAAQSDLLKKSYEATTTVDEILTDAKNVIGSYRTHKPKTEDSADLNNFPQHVMTGAAGYYASVYSEVVEVPAQFHFITYLTCLGSVLSPTLSIASVLDTQPRLYVVITGQSATDRKSTALAIGVNHFKSIVNGFKTIWGLGSAEGLNKALASDETSSLLLCFDEMKTFVNKTRIDGSILLPAVNTLFESNIFENYTKKIAIKLNDAHLSLLAATTIQTYERIYDSNFLAIGFPNRVFLVPGTAKKQFSLPGKVETEDLFTMRTQLVKILQHVGAGLELDLTPEAKKFYHKWYMNLEPSVHSKRLDTYSLRFMMLLAVNNLKSEIDLETARHATDLCNWQLAIRKINDPIDADSNISKMEERIRRVLKQRGPLKDGYLKQYVNARKYGLWVYGSALRNLQNADEVSRNRTTKELFICEE